MENYYDMNSYQIFFLTQHFVPLSIHLDETSSSFTTGNTFALNEIFQIVIEFPVPRGENDIQVVASECV